MRGLLQDYLRFLARRPSRHILTALPPLALSMVLGFLTYQTMLSEERWRQWAGDASHWFFFEGMGYVTIAALLCVPMLLEGKQSGERVWTSNRALVTVLWLGPFAFLGVMASLETFDSLRPFGVFVVITFMRGLQLYSENVGRRQGAERLGDRLIFSSLPIPVAAIVGFGVGVLSSRFIPALNDTAIEQALILGDDVGTVFIGRSLLCGAIYYAIFPVAASFALFLQEGAQPGG